MSIETKQPATGAHAVIANATDPSRRKDVLFRVRREPGEQMSSWVPVGAFLAISIVVVAMLNFIPGGQ